MFSCAPTVAFAPPNPVLVKCSGQRAPSASTFGECNGTRSSNVRTSCTPPALSPATNARTSRKQRLLHLLPTPPKSGQTTRLLQTQEICTYPGSVSREANIYILPTPPQLAAPY
ncbi:hypothetical protein B0H13DRAFT_2329566 [Mycena leptocephala]|nr:hypothetical protein B0H13DRAFT_2329566 [Mycena leptocephala]